MTELHCAAYAVEPKRVQVHYITLESLRVRKPIVKLL